jgi:probable HAF family extracellular repeat protein
MGHVIRWLAMVAIAVPAAAFAATTGYIAQPIGSLGGASIYGTGINASGQISGWGDTDPLGAIHRHAFLHRNGTLKDLGTLNGGVQSFAYALNDAGQLAGSASPAGGSLHAVFYGGGAITDLFAQLGAPASAYGINARGDAAGGRRDASGSTHAYRLPASGVAQDLGTLGGSTSQAYGINTFGDVTGFAHLPSEDNHAFLYDTRGLVDLGTFGGSSSVGYGIAPSGEVVGSAYLAGNAGPHAFVHDGVTMRDLGTLGGGSSSALAINAAGAIVGEASNTQGASRAFVYATGTMIDLNSVTTGLGGSVLTTATAINDAGQIVAMSCTGLLVCPMAFRLDPIPAAKVVAVEYYNAGFDHYFITAIADEIAKLDNGTFAGWSRTGGTFNVYVADEVGTHPVCRFFSTSFTPKSSHFYTPDPAECAVVKRNANWQFEGLVFNIAVPDANGGCAAGTQPVYRLYNNGMGAAPNHRYTTSLATRADMVAKGWIPEGYGPDAVGMCTPL